MTGTAGISAQDGSEGECFADVDRSDVLAVIPGVSYEQNGQRHAFIQIISASERRSWYVNYPIESFRAERRRLSLNIGSSFFSGEGLTLDIAADGLSLNGSVSFTGTVPYPVTWRSPGIMGWYRYMPRMECFHGVVSMHHTVTGSFSLNGRKFDCRGTPGYIEKDWGTSFPSAWIWMQSNSFPSQGVSCMLSIAKIPFLGRVFTGFLGFVLTGDRLIKFGTYTGAEVVRLETSPERTYAAIRADGKLIEWTGILGPASRLAAPRQGGMERSIYESLKGTITLRIRDKHQHVLFDETGVNAGIELSESRSLLPDSNRQNA